MIELAEHLKSTNDGLKTAVRQDVSLLSTYLSRFENHVGTTLNDPETSIDTPFRLDLKQRHESRKRRTIKFKLDLPKDTHSFKLAQPNVFKRWNDKEFSVLNLKTKRSHLREMA